MMKTPFQNGFFPFSIPRTKNEDYAKRILIQLTFSNVTVVVSFLVLEWQNNIFFLEKQLTSGSNSSIQFFFQMAFIGDDMDGFIF